MELTTRIREQSISTRIFCRFIFGSDCSCTETSCNEPRDRSKAKSREQERDCDVAGRMSAYHMEHPTGDNQVLLSDVKTAAHVTSLPNMTSYDSPSMDSRRLQRRRLSCQRCRTCQSYDNCVFATGNLSAWRLLAVCHCWIRYCLLG